MTTREDILSLADKLVREADEISRNLTAPGWRPTRSGIEDARNLLRRAAALLAAPTPPAAEAPGQELVALTYTNWRGETAERSIIPRGVWFGSTDWHPEPQWLLSAFDVEKQADRDFALKDFGPTPPTYADAEAKGFERGFVAGKEASAVLVESLPPSAFYPGAASSHADAIRSLASPAPKGGE